MDRSTIQKFLHDLNNRLNAATLNAFLLQTLHAQSLDKDALDQLQIALQNTNRLAREFQDRIHAEAAADGSDAISTAPER